MNSNPTHSLDEIASTIIAKGRVEPADVALLECHFGPSAVIDQDKAELLFKINSVVEDGKDTCQQWPQLFCQSICRFVVYDLNSPGEIAEGESAWLNEQIPEEHQLTSAELLLIRELQRSATSSCEQMKSLFTRANSAEPLSACPKADGDQ